MPNEPQYYVYIMTNKWNRVLYTGITNDLIRRVWEHKSGHMKGFTMKFRVHKLIYYEIYRDVLGAIAREKQIKNGSRRKKEELVKKMNPWWDDLSDKLI